MDYPVKISVIMPAYNADVRYLREAVESVLNQSFKDFELIVTVEEHNIVGGFGSAVAGILVEMVIGTYGDQLFPYDETAWYAPVQALMDRFIPTDAALFTVYPFFVLALTLAGSSHPRGMAVFRPLFGLGVVGVIGGMAVLSFADFSSALALTFWVVTIIMAYGWGVLLSYRVLFHFLQWLAGRVKHTDVRIARRWELLLSLPFFILVFAVWYWFEMR